MGFEPTKHMQQILSLSPLTTRKYWLCVSKRHFFFIFLYDYKRARAIYYFSLILCWYCTPTRVAGNWRDFALFGALGKNLLLRCLDLGFVSFAENTRAL